jgi:hypothetical protein
MENGKEFFEFWLVCCFYRFLMYLKYKLTTCHVPVELWNDQERILVSPAFVRRHRENVPVEVLISWLQRVPWILRQDGPRHLRQNLRHRCQTVYFLFVHSTLRIRVDSKWRARLPGIQILLEPMNSTDRRTFGIVRQVFRPQLSPMPQKMRIRTSRRRSCRRPLGRNWLFQ